MVIFRFLIHIVKKGYTYLHSVEISVRKTHHSSLCGLVLPGHHVSTLLREEHCSSGRNGAYSGFIHTYNQVSTPCFRAGKSRGREWEEVEQGEKGKD